MFDQPLTRLTFVSLIAVSMVSCGQRGPTAAESFQAYPIATPTPTATIHPLDATKQADDERIERELATAAALPSPVVYPTLRPAPSPQPIVTEISTDCDSLYDGLIRETNCWRTGENNLFMFVVVGADPQNLAQGKLDMYTANLNGTDTSPVSEYLTPTQSGTITITSVIPPLVYTETEDGTRFVFNLDTRTWEDPPPYP